MTTIAISPVGFVAMFTGFHAYDDEGYFLVLLRDYLSGQPLLTPAAPIYGPFFFETTGAVFKIVGVLPGQDAGRFLTLAIWLLASLGSGLTAYRLAGSIWLGVGAELLAFHTLGALTTEPMSPAALVSLLLVGLAAASVALPGRPRATGAVIGAAVAALCLIKINVGAFAAIAVVVAWAAGQPQPRRRLLLPAMALGIAVLPLVLMSSLLAVDWVRDLALVTALSGAGIGVVSVVSRERAAPLPAVWVAGGGAVLAVVCLAVAIAGGTRPLDLWTGLIVTSLRFPVILAWPLSLNAGHVEWAALATAGAIVVAVRARGRPSVPGPLRAGAGLFIWSALLFLPTPIALLGLPLAWIAAVPASGTPSLARVFLPALAVLESLQIYPVAGTQLSVGLLPLVFVGAVCLNDGIAEMRAAAERGDTSRRAANWFAPAAMIVNVPFFLLGAFLAMSAYSDGVPLGLPGAETVRVPADQAAALRGVTAMVDSMCSAFITYPGMNSFYVWTGQRQPADVRSEVWMITFDSNQQQALVDQLDTQPRLCVIKDQREIDFWTRGHDVAPRPLVEFVAASFVIAGDFGDYEVLVRRPSQ